MGLFNWGKKKNKQEQQIGEAFAAYGVGTNEVNKGNDRKAETARIENSRLAGQKKDQIIEKIGELRKIMSRKIIFNDLMLNIEDLISDFRSMPESDKFDKAALDSVEGFILKAIGDCINYCNRDSYVGVDACLSLINDLKNDRYAPGLEFKDPKYINARLVYNQRYLDIKVMEARITAIQARGASLKEKYNDPRFKAQQQSLMNEMLALKDEREQLNVRIGNLNKELTLMRVNMEEVKNSIKDRDIDSHVDIQAQGEEILEMRQEANARNYANERILDKVNNQTVRHTDSALSVDGNLGDSSVSAPQVDLDSLGF